MNISDSPLPGLRLIEPRRFGDHRGFFAEIWNRKAYEDQGIAIDWVQDNHSLSATPSTLRGLHFQAPPHAQAKLVRCGRGRLFDVVVDLRRGSPTYGQWGGFELSAENGHQLLIPAGFAHGFVTREPNTEIVYKCSDYYAPETEGAVAWEDPEIGIDWGLDGTDPILSDKDRAAPRLSGVDTPFTYEETAP
ncbi:dTDP-4-dehydrorhamnose 3,5-epimerase [Pseudooceanicola aestuarii]|uniref:dTDP-4-dehydrorhamnose 3,5-epimerase n=1 Tax=Pseudooceanicola aestuarii TaxID=2697319 RepID=UPI0013D7DFD9|nr:dTDP-4-dehydrorhamnose 3,5-epimerase [Pseudooceanicola aestuarii]